MSLPPMAVAGSASVARRARSRRRRARGAASNVGWYAVLTALAIVTVFPFAWMLLTSLKGPADPITSVPPQFLPSDPTLANYEKVLASLPIPRFFFNSVVVSVATGLLNVLVAALAAYPLAKMRFPGRDAIFYLLLATLIVPAQLTYIPSFVLAVNVFGYYDSLPALIFPNIVSAFNIFLLRQAFRGIPNDLLDAARVDGASEWRIWWQIAIPLVRPSLAAVAIFTFVTSWNDFLWPSLMLHTRDGMTLPVGLAALQGFFASDFRAVAAGVTMTVIPILLFFVLVQRYFIRGPVGGGQGVTSVLGRVMLAFEGATVPPRHRPAAGLGAGRGGHDLPPPQRPVAGAGPRADVGPAARGRRPRPAAHRGRPGGRAAPGPRRRDDAVRREHGPRCGRRRGPHRAGRGGHRARGAGDGRRRGLRAVAGPGHEPGQPGHRGPLVRRRSRARGPPRRRVPARAGVGRGGRGDQALPGPGRRGRRHPSRAGRSTAPPATCSTRASCGRSARSWPRSAPRCS